MRTHFYAVIMCRKMWMVFDHCHSYRKTHDSKESSPHHLHTHKKREYYIQLYHEKQKKNTRKMKRSSLLVQISFLYLTIGYQLKFWSFLSLQVSACTSLYGFSYSWIGSFWRLKKNVNQISMGNSIVFEFLTLAHTHAHSNTYTYTIFSMFTSMCMQKAR